MKCVFVQLRCQPGKTYDVAREVVLREIASEIYSTSGDFDLLAKIYVPEDEDIGLYLNERLLDVPGIVRSLTTITFKAIQAGDG